MAPVRFASDTRVAIAMLVVKLFATIVAIAELRLDWAVELTATTWLETWEIATVLAAIADDIAAI